MQALAEQKAQAAVAAQVNAQRDMIRQAVEGEARKQVTEGVLSAAGLGMTLEQYDAAVAAGQVPDEVQAQIATAVASQMTGMESILEAKTDEQVQALIDQNMQSEEVQAQIAQALARAQGGRQSLQALKAQQPRLHEGAALRGAAQGRGKGRMEGREHLPDHFLRCVCRLCLRADRRYGRCLRRGGRDLLALCLSDEKAGGSHHDPAAVLPCHLYRSHRGLGLHHCAYPFALCAEKA